MTYRIRFTALDNVGPIFWLETGPTIREAVDRGFENAARYGFQIRSVADITAVREG